jgi:hypothetical protein
MKSHEEFMKDVDKAKSLPAQTDGALNEESQHPSDLKAVKRQNEKSKAALKEYREKFDADGSMVEGAKEYLSEEAQTEDDLEAIAKRDAVYTEGEVKNE